MKAKKLTIKSVMKTKGHPMDESMRHERAKGDKKSDRKEKMGKKKGKAC